jgi:hypothetical protein
MCAYRHVHKPPAEGSGVINLPLYKTAVSTWAVLIEGTEWLIAVQLEYDVDKEVILSSFGCNSIE